jgi:hypothetical protein
MAEPRVCPVCARPQKLLFDTADGPSCASCLRYSGLNRVEPVDWRINLTRGPVRREWPGRPPDRGEGAGVLEQASERREHG